MRFHPSRGFSLVEMMTVLVIIAILTLIGLPSFANWLQNSRTRSVAESLQNGVRYAQGEAARLSKLTKLTTTSSGWSVTYVKPDGSDSTPLQTSPSGNLNGVSITPLDPTTTVLEFNDLGRVSSAATTAGPFSMLTNDATFNVTNPNGSRRLNVLVSIGGKVRMCDPDKSVSSSPDGC